MIQLFIACLVLYSQMTQETAAEEQQPAPLPTCVRHVEIRTFEIRTISAAHAACMEGTHAKPSKESSLSSCMASATKNDMNSFRVDNGVCYIYLASPPADDTGTQQIYVARNQTDPPTFTCCPPSFTMVPEFGCLYINNEKWLNRKGAMEHCKALGGQLYSSSSLQNTLDLHDHLKKVAPGRYYVAAERVDGTWQWRDGREVAAEEWNIRYSADLSFNGAVLATDMAPPLYNSPDSVTRYPVCQASSI